MLSNFVFVPSTPHAGVDDDSRCFSLDFLPDGGIDISWELVDCRGGLLLSKKRPGYGGVATARRFTDLVVCEPLTRRYQVIPCPANLKFFMCLDVFLLDAGHDVAAGGRAGGMSSFRVIAVLFDCHTWLDYRGMPMSIMFSSSGGHGIWQVVQGEIIDDVDLPGWIEHITFVGRANGRLYWGNRARRRRHSRHRREHHRILNHNVPEKVWVPYDKYTFRLLGHRRRWQRRRRGSTCCPRDKQRSQGLQADRRQRPRQQVGAGEDGELAGGDTWAAGARGGILPAR